MDERAKKAIFWSGGAALLGLLFAGRKQLHYAIGVLMDSAQQQVFKAVIPTVARPYADVILQVASEQNVSPFLIVQLGYRETLWGTSSALDQPGPSGRGDGGHGHGLMQIDDRSYPSWLATYDWTDPYTNVSKGVEILRGKLAFFATRGVVPGLTDGTLVTLGPKSATRRGVPPGTYRDPRPLFGDALIQAAVAAYNTGEGNVLESLAAGLPADATTAKGNYGADVLARMASLVSAFNSRSPTAAA